ncbi:MAG: hypothetical protein K6U04_08650 [Armatimonadetes bacterium]|nr:hypothetical protein [Armatimonadota bacterium]
MFLTSNPNRGGLKAAPAILIALLLLLFVILPVYAGENEMHGIVNYRDGVLYVFHWDDAPARLYIPPELKVEGQEVATRTGKNPVQRGFEMEARFKPATSGSYYFEPKKDIDFDLLVARLTGVGDVMYEIGGEKKVIHVNSNDQRRFDVKLPDFEIDYSSPYSVSSSGNIKLTKVFTGESNKGYKNKDIWAYTADGGILDGTMTLRHHTLPSGENRGPTFTFPFCPGSASYWLSNLPEPKPDKTPPPETPPKTNPGNFPGKRYLLLLIPAAAALLLLPFARQRVNVSVELELTESGAQAVVYRDVRGPEKVRVVLDVNSKEQEFILKRNESRTVAIEGIGYIQVAIRTPGRRNVSKNTRAELLIRSETDGRNQDR